MNLNCPLVTSYQIFTAQLSYELMLLIKKGQYVQKGIRQDEAGREKEAFLQYFHENELQYLGFFLLLLRYEKEFSGLECTDLFTNSEKDCIIANFRCLGIDVRPLIEQFCSYDTCTGEGIGNAIIESFFCPFLVYPNTEPEPNPLCSGEGIGNEIIEDLDCGFTSYPD